MGKLIFAMMFWVSFATATEHLGQVSCYTLDRPVSYLVNAEIFGQKSENGLNADFVNISLSSYNWDTHTQSTTLRTWENVFTLNDRNFSMHFKNGEVELDAFYDDVGAMSFFAFDGEEYQLMCDIWID